MKTEIEFYTTFKQAWQAMYDDCRQAKKSIDFEQYILLNDNVGNKFLQLFRDKAREGVQVRLVLDGIGSRAVKSSPYIKEIRQAGGSVRFYNNMRWWKIIYLRRLFPRTHCKTMLIDNEISYIGGVCIAEHMNDWHDLHIRVTGDLVQTIRGGHGSEGYNESDPHFKYLVHHPRYNRNPIYNSLLQNINEAKENVCLCTPYFLPPPRLYRAMIAAAKRGVNVRLMLSQKSDVPLMMMFSRLYFSKLIKSGVKIGLYTKAIMHAKYGIIDDEWATLGSTNLDYLSLLMNKESNIVATRKDVIVRLQNIFDEDFASCIEEA